MDGDYTTTGRGTDAVRRLDDLVSRSHKVPLVVTYAPALEVAHVEVFPAGAWPAARLRLRG